MSAGAQLAAERDEIAAKYQELSSHVDTLAVKEWNAAANHIMLNGPLVRAKSVADRVGEATDLLRQCKVMLDMLPSENFLLQPDDLADLQLVLTKAANKVHHAETAIIDEEERRAIEEAKYVPVCCVMVGRVVRPRILVLRAKD